MIDNNEISIVHAARVIDHLEPDISVRVQNLRGTVLEVRTARRRDRMHLDAVIKPHLDVGQVRGSTQ